MWKVLPHPGRQPTWKTWLCLASSTAVWRMWVGIHVLYVQKGKTMLWCKPEACLCNEKYWSRASFSKTFLCPDEHATSSKTKSLQWFQHHPINTNNYKPGPGLPDNVIAKVKPVYDRLSNDELLKKCLDGKTQNQNESLNGMIWNRLPKGVFCRSNSLEIWCLWYCCSLQHWFQGCSKYYGWARHGAWKVFPGRNERNWQGTNSQRKFQEQRRDKKKKKSPSWPEKSDRWQNKRKRKVQLIKQELF